MNILSSRTHSCKVFIISVLLVVGIGVTAVTWSDYNAPEMGQTMSDMLLASEPDDETCG